MKKIVAALLCVAMVLALCACGGSSSTPAASNGEKTFNLRLAHNLAEDHAVHIQLTAFADAVRCGREAYLAGLAQTGNVMQAEASSPLTAFLD